MNDSESSLETLWHKRWTRADFSWRGLASRQLSGWEVVNDSILAQEVTSERYGQPNTAVPVSARRPATLQDYWRADPVDGRLRTDDELETLGELRGEYHLVHQPANLEDGAPYRAIFQQIVRSRLAVARETSGMSQFRNVTRAIALWAPNSIDLRAQLMGVIDPCESYNQGRWSGLPDVLHICADHALLNSTFESLRFGNGASFASAVVNAYDAFNIATFEGDAFFYECFTRSDFSGTRFVGTADFSQSKIGGRFFNARFDGRANFHSAEITNGGFDRAEFNGEADFDEAEFRHSAMFHRAAFKRPVSFRKSTFSGETSFADSTFTSADFSGSTFTGPLSFEGCRFDQNASFAQIFWPAGPGDAHSAFNRAVFAGACSFAGAGFGNLASFDGASFGGHLQYDDASEAAAERIFRQELRNARSAARIDALQFVRDRSGSELPASKWEVEAHRRRAIDLRLAELERGCRTLKQAMNRMSNTTREQQFYRFELIVRRAQRDTPAWEKAISLLYAFTSNYGISLLRPLLSIIVIMLAFATALWVWATSLQVADRTSASSVAQAIEASWMNVFRPLSLLTPENVRSDTLVGALLLHDDWTALGVRVLATVESLLAVILAFLFALAVRRRFQLS